MFLFLTVLLLSFGESTQQGSDFIISQLNSLRALVAGGSMDKQLSSTNMFAVKSNPNMELYAAVSTVDCQSNNMYSSLLPKNLIQNFNSGALSGLSAYAATMIALMSWYYTYTPQSDGKIIYTNEGMKDFANMMYYKQTEAGCHYRVCNTSNMYAVACVFGSAPQLGEPVYITSANGVGGCRDDSDCDQHLPSSKCATPASAEEFPGLCYAGNATTYSEDTTTTTTTTTTTATISLPPVPAPSDLMTRLALLAKISEMHNNRRSSLAQEHVPNGSSEQNAPKEANINEKGVYIPPQWLPLTNRIL